MSTSVGEPGLPLIPFSKPYRASGEVENLTAVLDSGHVHGDGQFTRIAADHIQRLTGANHVLLTTSGTHALDMAAILLDLVPGDEVIVPSYTFSSGATSIALRGATVVFADIDMVTGNIDPKSLEAAVTSRTRAISVMHYGGVGVDMSRIAPIATRHDLPIIEDNAHGLGASYRGQPLGSFGVLGAQSFHDTKNVHGGEAGAILINSDRFAERAEILREKGTDRSKFLRGDVDKYTWVDHGSSYLPSELNAAVLSAQLAAFDEIQNLRSSIWRRYRDALGPWAHENDVQLMSPPEGSSHPAHVFWMLMPSGDDRNQLIRELRAQGITATFHYQPLHDSPAGRRFGRAPDDAPRARQFAERILRLPLWAGMSDDMVNRVIDAVQSFEYRPSASR